MFALNTEANNIALLLFCCCFVVARVIAYVIHLCKSTRPMKPLLLPLTRCQQAALHLKCMIHRRTLHSFVFHVTGLIRTIFRAQ